ncbi:hypothetical protein POM88_045167 [Heracleum sosnowskyi]|uniref:FAR1 domain-containing protein n=1 Tax=Heracleum sosnowskyi TaxID=360622 RepID=A0AAD8M655_9APIA|nr:hypothetical protein POM88_045167 [Heracleum sosnowskyi]
MLGCSRKLSGLIRNEPFDPRMWIIPVAALSFMNCLGIEVYFLNIPYKRSFLANPAELLNISYLEFILKTHLVMLVDLLCYRRFPGVISDSFIGEEKERAYIGERQRLAANGGDWRQTAVIGVKEALAHIEDTYCDDDVLNDSVDLIVDGDSFFGEVDDSLSTQFVSPGCTKYLVPKCSVDLKPFVGQVFPSVHDAISFYTVYARICGFSIRLGPDKVKTGASSSKTKRRHMFSRCGCRAMISIKYNKSYLYEVKSFVEHHNHKLAGTVGKKFLKVNRSMTIAHQNFAFNASKVKIGPLKSFGLMKELLGGYDKVGATTVDFKNWNRDFRGIIIGNADIQIMLNKFKAMRESSNGDFYYEYDADNCGKLIKLFRVDSVGRRNYDVFGDVISVDATFNTNNIIWCLFHFVVLTIIESVFHLLLLRFQKKILRVINGFSKLL